MTSFAHKIKDLVGFSSLVRIWYLRLRLVCTISFPSILPPPTPCPTQVAISFHYRVPFTYTCIGVAHRIVGSCARLCTKFVMENHLIWAAWLIIPASRRFPSLLSPSRCPLSRSSSYRTGGKIVNTTFSREREREEFSRKFDLTNASRCLFTCWVVVVFR